MLEEGHVPRITIMLDNETHDLLSKVAETEHRSKKGQAEKFIIDAVNKRSDGLTDQEYLTLVNSTR